MHYVDVTHQVFRNENELVLAGKPKKVLNISFVIAIIIFAACMLLKANVDQPWAAIPLGIAALGLFSRVWNISENGKVVFDKNDSNMYRIYKHLGYMQVIYTTPLSSVTKAEVRTEGTNAILLLILDNLEIICISNMKISESNKLQDLSIMINEFIGA
jgi:hypothetical protein